MDRKELDRFSKEELITLISRFHTVVEAMSTYHATSLLGNQDYSDGINYGYKHTLSIFDEFYTEMVQSSKKGV